VAVLEEKEFQRRIQKIEGLVRTLESVADPRVRASAQDLVRSLMDLHGAGLDRLLSIVAGAGEPGRAIFDDLARDDLVSKLLLLYGLHPVDLETRVAQALETVRPYLRSHGGGVELLSASEGAVRLRFSGSCHGCASSAMTLKLAIEDAIYAAAPDVESLEVEGVVESTKPTGLVQLGVLPPRNGGAAAAENGSGWEPVGGLDSLAHQPVSVLERAGRSLLLCQLGETLYAYGNNCPGCEGTLSGAVLRATSLICGHCGQGYDVARAGRGLDRPGLHLEPFPLLVEQGQVKVAFPH
jgi:Fe-S cluster biogenesis protein NfuA/nitrite reductase/ring-hydroxylating ferredoxin subunit